MRFSPIASALFLVGSIGCGSQDAATPNASADIVTAAIGENEVTLVDVKLDPSGAADVAYTPAPYAAGPGAPVRYLGFPIDAAAATSFDVQGEFPGTPEVLLADADFNIVAGTEGTTDGKIGRASLAVPSAALPKFALVRDKLWAKPMTFQVRLTRSE